ncbi:MAG: SGNH/GDSL hydrolase family protein [Chthoniobacteraceae bacterium]
MTTPLAFLCGVSLFACFSFVSLHGEDTALPAEIIQRSVVSIGDTARLQRAMAKARRGEKVVIAFVGGSITWGARASTASHSYVSLVADWWRQEFPSAQIEVVNAGIGATGTNFAALRLQRDVLSRNPDVLFVEFAVNDKNLKENAETLEGVVRQGLKSSSRPALILLFMVSKSGESAQEWFVKVGSHYGLTMISYRDAIYPEIQSGKLKWEDLSPDTVHSNDIGHRYTAQLVSSYLKTILKTLPENEKKEKDSPVPAPLFTDLYDSTVLTAGDALKPCTNQGWQAISDRNVVGWKATEFGSEIEFETHGTVIYLQYWKINGPMGKVSVTVDGENSHEIDGWFDQTWGGYFCMQVIGENLSPGNHRVRIKLLSDCNASSSGHEFIITAMGSAGL